MTFSSRGMHAAFLLSFSLLFTPFAHADNFGVDEAVHEALKNNPSILQAREKLNQLRYDKATIRAALFPSIAAVASGYEKKDSVLDRPAAAVNFGGDPYNVYDVNLTLNQAIFKYGSLSAVRAAEYDREMANNDLEIAERSLTTKVIDAYYRIVLNQNLLNLYLQDQKIIEESLSTSQSRYHTGRGQLLDVLSVRTQMALVKPKIDTSHNQLEIAVSDLTNLMGNTKHGSINLSGEIPLLKIKDVESQIDLHQFYLPELQKILFAYERLQEQRAITFGKDLPSLALVGNYEYSSYTKAELITGAANTWGAGLALNVPIFSGFSSIYERKSLNSQEAQIEHQKRDTGNNLILSQVKSRKTLETAESSLSSSVEAADLAVKSVNEARRDFALATIDFLQLLQIQQSYIEAVTSLNQLKLDSVNAYASYFAASGQPLEVLVEMLSGKLKAKNP